MKEVEIIYKEKLTKQDRQFLINLNHSNRDFLINSANIILNSLLSFSAIIISIYSGFVSFVGIGQESLFVGIVVVITLAPYWIWSMEKYKKMTKHAKKFNEKYQKYYFELYPWKKKELH